MTCGIRYNNRVRTCVLLTCLYITITYIPSRVCAGAGWQNKVTLEKNGLSGLIVAVDATVPEDPTLVPRIQVSLPQ